jgi:hypothetical protein
MSTNEWKNWLIKNKTQIWERYSKDLFPQGQWEGVKSAVLILESENKIKRPFMSQKEFEQIMGEVVFEVEVVND